MSPPRLKDARALPPALLTASWGRRSKWVVAAVWAVLLVVFAQVGTNLADVRNSQLATADELPDGAESAQLTRMLREDFASGETFPVVVVYRRAGGLSEADRQRTFDDAREAAGVPFALRPVAPFAPGAASGQVSRNGDVAFTVVPLATRNAERRTESIERLRESVGEDAGGLQVRVTGAAALQSDVAEAIEAADVSLLLATAVLVLILMAFIYRSPIVALIPLGVVGVSYAITLGLVYLYAKATGETIETTSVTILAVLMFGAGTDYCLLLVARYSAELPDTDDTHHAMAGAMPRAAPAIGASGLTVMGAMLTLLAADIATSKTAGPVYAIGVGTVLLASLTLLPAVLVIVGRRGFWPNARAVAHRPASPPSERSVSGVLRSLGASGSMPVRAASGVFPALRPQDGASAAEKPVREGVLQRVGGRLLNRPALALAVCIAALGAGALGLTRYVEGIDQTEAFRSSTEATEGFDVLRAGFPAGILLPTTVLVQRADGPVSPGDLAAVTQRLRTIAGVASVSGATNVSRDRRAATLSVVFADDPFGEAALERVREMRRRLDGVAPRVRALVGQGTAARLDYRESAHGDLYVVLPLVLVVISLALVALLRALIAPMYLLATVVLSFCGTFGLGLLVFDAAFGLETIDPGVTLLAFIFLVALGVDYNIFLMERVRAEARTHGTREGMLRALGATGPVITSAGVVLAGTFAVLMVLPLDAMLQIGFLVAVGVLLDTFLVRTIMVPAITLLAGERSWWPSRMAQIAPASSLPAVSATQPHEDAARIEPGERVGPYRVESFLGEGGMARVYRGSGPDGESVAVKVVRPELADDPIYRRRFEREARAVAGIEHPHVVPVLTTGEHEGLPYMAHRFLVGGTLEEKIRREGALELRALVRLCLQVAAGLGMLHERGLVHRDVKPANILLDEGGSALIADFGLAKDHDASVLTQPGQALGSLDYMAPEQIRGEEVSPGTDVYALGCVAWECLCGAPPFADRQGIQVLWAHLRDDPPELRDRRPDVPEGLRFAVLRALAKEPDRRPPTATAFARLVEVGTRSG